MMDDIKVYEDIALSDDQLMNLIDGKAKLVLYPNLVDYSSIDEVLGKHGACILLFEAKPNYGHWTCLHKRGGDIEFFNPYGGLPDDSLEYIPLAFRKISNQLKPELSMLMMESPYTLSYNEHKFQKHGKDIKTCGRHCALRLIFRDLTLNEYAQLLKQLKYDSGLSTDELVSYLTASPEQLRPPAPTERGSPPITAGLRPSSGLHAGRRRR